MSDYYTIPTTLGLAKLAAAANNNQALTLSHMAFGDANGVPYLPNSRANATALVNEQYRVALEYVTQDTQNPNVFIIKARIPANIGGFDICELGIFDSEGDLIYLANYPRTFKPAITQGGVGELNIKLHVQTAYSSSINIVLNPQVITLTQVDADARYALKTELPIQATTSILGISRLADQSDVTFGQNDNTIVTPTRLKNGYAVDGSINGYMRLPSFLSNLTLQWGKYTGGNSDGTIPFHIPFVLGVVFIDTSPLWNANVNDGNAPDTHIKTYDNSGFSFASGVESGGNDVHNPYPLDFFWFALGF